MAKDVRQLVVFVSSPGDVDQERKVLDEVVRRINGTNERVRLDLFRWQEDVAPNIRPGRGGAQAVIDGQMPDYDIYLGIMASRFGTPAGRWGSGTEAEFRQALRKCNRRTGRPWIMVFFKELKAPPRTVDEIDQYRRVVLFREELSKRGVVGSYTELRGCETGFCEQAEQHLRQAVMKLTRRGAPGRAGRRPGGARRVRLPAEEMKDQDRRLRKEEPPTRVDKRADLVARSLPDVFDVISPCYLLDENFFFLDWNISFDELIAKPAGLARDDHALDFVRKLANCGEVMEHSKATFGAGRENPLVDTELLQFVSAKYGLIEFLKIAAQLTDDRGGLLAWAVNLNIVSADKRDRLQKDLALRLKEKLNWTRYAYCYDKLLLPFDDYHDLVKLVVSRIGRARRCIDLGAGTGNGTLELLRGHPDRVVWAVEGNEGMLRCLQRKVADHARRGMTYDGRLIQVKDDITTLSSLKEDKDGFFDAAILINVLYSVDEPVACLKQANRVLKPGGVLSLSTPHKRTDVERLFRRMSEVLRKKGKFDALRSNYEAAKDVHRRMERRIHRDSREMIQSYLDRAGFDVLEWRDHEYVDAVYVVKAVKKGQPGEG